MKKGDGSIFSGFLSSIKNRTVPFFILFVICHSSFAEEPKKEEPIIVNGDTVEYSMDNKSVSATGNVLVTHKGAKLTCDKLTVNMATKEGTAEGNARVDDKMAVIEGEKIIYNFTTKAGTIINADFRSNPYFGRGQTVKKISDAEFLALKGYMTTCSYDAPHYRINSKSIDFFPRDKVLTKNNSVYIAKTPVFYLPRYNHSLKDPLMHVQLSPGKTKDWGAYMLTAWRYSLNDNAVGRIYFDYRQRRGVAQGLGLNYTTENFGRGDYKYYYMQERPRNFLEGDPAEFQRYFIRWRHKWDMAERTNISLEYYKIVDSKRMILGTNYNFLKDYFYREYEKDSLPLSYALLHHDFQHSSLDFMLQKRTNRWYAQTEKLPEINYSLPDLRIGESPFYFKNNTQAANLNKKNAVPSPASADLSIDRFDTTSGISLPAKVAFFELTPFLRNRETIYNRNVFGSSFFDTPRTVFYAGLDTSTKFYRIFNVKSKPLGMEINNLRHIITPVIKYSYNHEPTILNSKLVQIDGVDSVTRSNSAGLELSNKLQTKRNNQNVDLADFKISSTYTFKPKSGDKRGSNLSDILFDLKLLPYSWLRVDADTTYTRSATRFSPTYHRFSNANYDLYFNFGRDRTVGIGQRYQLKGGNELTFDLDWRISPKWKFSLYQRRNRGHDPALKRGLREQEYSLSRDLHCWTIDVNYNVRKGQGETIWFIFRLKAFPELEFEYNQSYHAPKPGSQSNP